MHACQKNKLHLCKTALETFLTVFSTGAETMGNLQHISPFDFILPDLRATNRRQVFRHVATYLARAVGLESDMLLSRILESDRETPSALGDGLAVVNLVLPGLDRPYVLLARMGQGADFQAPDGVSIDVLCLILSPARSGESLQRLARVSRLLREKGLRHRLRGAESLAAVQALIHGPDVRLAA